MRKILPSVLLFIALLADVMLVPTVSHGWLSPMFTLVLVNCYGLLLGRTSGLWYALVAGLFLDINVGNPLGLMTLTMAFVGYMGGFMGRTFSRSYLTPALSGALGRLAMEVAVEGYLVWYSASPSLAWVSRALMRMAMDAVLVTAFYWALNFMIKPTRSRFAAR